MSVKDWPPLLSGVDEAAPLPALFPPRRFEVEEAGDDEDEPLSEPVKEGLEGTEPPLGGAWGVAPDLPFESPDFDLERFCRGRGHSKGGTESVTGSRSRC